MANKALLAVGLAAIVVLAGVAAWYFLYEGTVTVNLRSTSGLMAASLDGWDHVDVTFSAVQIHESGKDNASWTTVSSSTQIIDLVALTSVSQLLGSAKLSPGHYEQIRLTVVKVTGVLAGSTTPIDITVVNDTAKIAGQFTVSSGATTTITVDVDLASCLHGNTVTGYTFTPAFAATVG